MRSLRPVHSPLLGDPCDLRGESLFGVAGCSTRSYLTPMFEDLQRLFRESVAAFRSELEKREPEDEVAHLLGSMRRELVEVRASIPRLEEDLAKQREALAGERQGLGGYREREDEQRDEARTDERTQHEMLLSGGRSRAELSVEPSPVSPIPKVTSRGLKGTAN